MQPLTSTIRPGWTDEETRNVIQGQGVHRIIPGAELITRGGALIRDISGSVSAAKVARQNYATIHGTCDLTISEDLPWGNSYVRLYQLRGLDREDRLARFNLGEFVLTSPVTRAGTAQRSVTGYDKLHILNRPVGDAYAVPKNTSYAEAIKAVILASGETRYTLDTSGSASTMLLKENKVFPMFNEQGADSESGDTPSGEMTTWLQILNFFLLGAGYAGAWYNADGFLQCLPYVAPSSRAVEWLYTANDNVLGNVHPEVDMEDDMWDVPNVWVFTIQSTEEEPTLGNGMWIYRNEDRGPMSLSALGYERTAYFQYDVASQAVLEQRGAQRVAADLRGSRVITDVSTVPNPLTGHFDLYGFQDARLGFSGTVLSRSWELDLFASRMKHVWEVVS